MGIKIATLHSHDLVARTTGSTGEKAPVSSNLFTPPDRSIEAATPRPGEYSKLFSPFQWKRRRRHGLAHVGAALGSAGLVPKPPITVGTKDNFHVAKER